MSTTSHQLSLAETSQTAQDFFQTHAASFFSVMREAIDLETLIPSEFYAAFYRHRGRHRDYPLEGFLAALIFQKIFSIPTDSLLLLFLQLCPDFRDFCGFRKVPDAPLITRFKQKFLPYLEIMFKHLVDLTEPICQAINPSLAQMLAFDTSGIELYVHENNPKTLNALIKRLKAYYKADKTVDPYKMAYGLMPSRSEACPNAQQQYINGHFCYADKFSLLTNGLGIVRHIAFLDDAFKADHPALFIAKKSDSPDEDKSMGDSSALKPVLQDYFSDHPLFKPSTFLGDAAFDTIDTYGFLQEDFHFSKVFIPYNPRNESTLKEVGYNAYGYPLCPNDPTLAMKRHGLCHEKGRADRYKWGCPKMHCTKGQWLCDCEHPCSTAKKGRTTYTYDHMAFRMFPGVQRDSQEWVRTYKIRSAIERTINHFKINLCVAGRKSRDHLTTKADVYLAGIVSQITVLVANHLSCPQYLRSLKPLLI